MYILQKAVASPVHKTTVLVGCNGLIFVNSTLK